MKKKTFCRFGILLTTATALSACEPLAPQTDPADKAAVATASNQPAPLSSADDHGEGGGSGGSGGGGGGGGSGGGGSGGGGSGGGGGGGGGSWGG